MVSIEEEKRVADKLYEEAKLRYLIEQTEQNLFTLTAAMHRLNLIDDQYYKTKYFL